jgi:hypothetical protein
VAVAADIDDSENIYAYVCSIGGAQKAGGNIGPAPDPISQLQVCGPDSITGVFSLLATINANSNDTSTTVPPGGADFQDVALYDGFAYGVVASYNSGYTSYDYRLFKVAITDLRAGTFTTSTVTSYPALGIPAASAPAGPAWILAPSGDSGADPLWLVSGDEANTLSTGLTVTLKGTPATLGVASPTAINAHINRAAVVIHGTPPQMRGAAAGRSASVTKVSRRPSPEEIKRRQK